MNPVDAFFWSAFDLFDWIDHPVLPKPVVRDEVDALLDDLREGVVRAVEKTRRLPSAFHKMIEPGKFPEGMGFSYSKIEHEWPPSAERMKQYPDWDYQI